MVQVRYDVVPHDAGWAYKADGVFSETFPTHDHALAAARSAAERQRHGGPTQVIEFEDSTGHWHREIASGADRPETLVDDPSPRNHRRS